MAPPSMTKFRDEGSLITDAVRPAALLPFPDVYTWGEQQHGGVRTHTAQLRALTPVKAVARSRPHIKAGCSVSSLWTGRSPWQTRTWRLSPRVIHIHRPPEAPTALRQPWGLGSQRSKRKPPGEERHTSGWPQGGDRLLTPREKASPTKSHHLCTHLHATESLNCGKMCLSVTHTDFKLSAKKGMYSISIFFILSYILK